MSGLGAPPNKSRLRVRTSDIRGRLHPTAVLLPWLVYSQLWATTKGMLFAAVLEKLRLCLKYICWLKCALLVTVQQQPEQNFTKLRTKEQRFAIVLPLAYGGTFVQNLCLSE